MRTAYRLAIASLLLTACGGGGGGFGYFPTDGSGNHDDQGAPKGDLAVPGGSDLAMPGDRDFAVPNETDLAMGPNCADGIRDGQETDVDCGGPDCGPCVDGRRCLINRDCVSQQCTGGICMAQASCNDGIKDGNETDVDCGGGRCPTCINGKHCIVDGDCTSNACRGGVCVDQCHDGVQDGNETDVDCGGGTCPTCANGKSCLGGGDCLSNLCTTGVCCGVGTANCDGIKANGCNVNTKTNNLNCGACGNSCNGLTCVNAQCVNGGNQVMVGKYTLPGGPAWAGMPPTYSCVEACSMLYGAGNYSCSTTPNVLDHQAAVVCYGHAGCPLHPDTYKLGATYVQGSCSAYVNDGACAAATNYCWR